MNLLATESVVNGLLEDPGEVDRIRAGLAGVVGWEPVDEERDKGILPFERRSLPRGSWGVVHE